MIACQCLALRVQAWTLYCLPDLGSVRILIPITAESCAEIPVPIPMLFCSIRIDYNDAAVIAIIIKITRKSNISSSTH